MPDPRPIDIAKLRHRVIVERRAGTLNDFRQENETWSTFATVWADVRTLAGRELLTATQVRPETSARVTMRHGAVAVTAEDRINFAGRILRILAVYDPEERGRVLWLDCAEWTGADDA